MSDKNHAEGTATRTNSKNFEVSNLEVFQSSKKEKVVGSMQTYKEDQAAFQFRIQQVEQDLLKVVAPQSQILGAPIEMALKAKSGVVSLEPAIVCGPASPIGLSNSDEGSKFGPNSKVGPNAHKCFKSPDGEVTFSSNDSIANRTSKGSLKTKARQKSRGIDERKPVDST
ncbi:hypothetical protein ACFE04_028133 [Oxalis oulophora]